MGRGRPKLEANKGLTAKERAAAKKEHKRRHARQMYQDALQVKGGVVKKGSSSSSGVDKNVDTSSCTSFEFKRR